MAIKPWYKLATPREDLRDGRPLDASEFAVHLDQIRDGRAPPVYQDPERFFERTFLTKGLSGLAAEVIRRLSGEKTDLRQNDEIQTGISPSFLVRNWPPAFKEWSTKAVREAFYASRCSLASSIPIQSKTP